MIFYCSADPSGPKAAIDWLTRVVESREAAIEEIREESLHTARGGRAPWGTLGESRISPEDLAAGLASGYLSVDGVGDADKYGGKVARLARSGADVDLGSGVFCSGCDAPIHVK